MHNYRSAIVSQIRRYLSPLYQGVNSRVGPATKKDLDPIFVLTLGLKIRSEMDDRRRVSCRSEQRLLICYCVDELFEGKESRSDKERILHIHLESTQQHMVGSADVSFTCSVDVSCICLGF